MGINPLLCFGILYIGREVLGTNILLKDPSVAKDLPLGSTRQKIKITVMNHTLPYHMKSNQIRTVFSFAGLINGVSIRNNCFNGTKMRVTAFLYLCSVVYRKENPAANFWNLKSSSVLEVGHEMSNVIPSCFF